MPSIISKLWLKMFYSPYFFTIALRRKNGSDTRIPEDFAADYVIPAGYKKWAADPMLVDDHGKTYLFYEAVNNGKGRIEVAQVCDDCTISEPVVILEDTCHYSYPFVFKYDEDWYMIPESSASNEIRLYKAEAFPEKWKLETVLLQKNCVDTTVFEQHENTYLLTYLLCPGTERVVPQAYKLFWEAGHPLLNQISWDTYDELECRGAGPLYRNQGHLIRPAQKNEEQSYGNGLVFYKVNVDDAGYREKYIAELNSRNVSAGKVWMNGLHTYVTSERFEAIDIRCREFDFWKIPRVLWNKAKEKSGEKKH